MSILQFLNGKSTDSNDLPSEVQKAVQVLAEFAPRQHPPGPAGPEEFEGVEINFRNVGTALSRQIIKTYLETRNRHYPKRIERGGQTWYRAAPTPNTIITAVGSGVVEAANKTLAAARMKRSGMRWHIKSGQAIPGFRPCRSQASWLPPGR